MFLEQVDNLLEKKSCQIQLKKSCSSVKQLLNRIWIIRKECRAPVTLHLKPDQLNMEEPFF